VLLARRQRQHQGTGRDGSSDGAGRGHGGSVTEEDGYGRTVPDAPDVPLAGRRAEDQLRSVVGADPSRTALFFDFDGTLAPIVRDPASAAAIDGAVELLERLAQRFARVAVVSGRPRSFLVERVGAGVDLSGVYGLEIRIAGVEHDHEEADRWRDVIAGAAADGSVLPAGVLVESKGLSLTVHYREVPAAEPDVLAWADGVGRATGLEVRPAKRSVELHPPLAVDKGTSVLALSEGCATVAYLGDDVGDLPAFAALDELAARGITTCKVAIASDELHEDVAGAADVILDGPHAVLAALEPLA
jgi:trehalose 6-phosphate phosphatase